MSTAVLRFYKKARKWWSKRAIEWFFVNSLPCKFYEVNLAIVDDVYLEKKFESRGYNRISGISVMLKREDYTQEAERFGISISDQITVGFLRTQVIPKPGDIFVVQDTDDVYHLEDPDNKTFQLAYLIRAATPYLEGMMMQCTCERIDTPFDDFTNVSE